MAVSVEPPHVVARTASRLGVHFSHRCASSRRRRTYAWPVRHSRTRTPSRHARARRPVPHRTLRSDTRLQEHDEMTAYTRCLA
jgi:hypothetical protein